MKNKGTLLSKLFNSDKGKGPDWKKLAKRFDFASPEEVEDFLEKFGLIRKVGIKFMSNYEEYRGGFLGAFVDLYYHLIEENEELRTTLSKEVEKLSSAEEEIAWKEKELEDLSLKYKAVKIANKEISKELDKLAPKIEEVPPPVPPTNALVPTKKKKAKANADEKREYNDHDKAADLLKIKENCLTLESKMNEIIIGQESGIHEVSRIVRSGFNVLSENLPVVIYIHGATGIGKTYTAEILNQLLFEGLLKVPDFCRIQGELYDRDHNLSGLIGTSQGYVGYDDEGKLISNARENPYSITLFDEIEKMAVKCQRVLLGMLSTGEIQSAKGDTYSCSNHIIILTSNLGERDIATKKHLGFSQPNDEQKRADAENYIKNLLKQSMDPELIGRIGNFVHYFSLTEPHLRTILDNKLNHLENRAFKKTNSTGQLFIQNGARDQLYRLAVPHLSYGARSMNQVLEKYIISNTQIDNALSSNNSMIVDFADNKFSYRAVKTQDLPRILEQEGDGIDDVEITITAPVRASDLPTPPKVPDKFKK